MNILVTGVSGVLGFGIAEYLLEQNFKVQGVVNSKKSGISHENYVEYQFDLSYESTKLKEILNCSDYLVHCANYVPTSIDLEYASEIKKSLNMNLNVLEMFFQSKCKNIIFISSVDVYSFKGNGVTIEEDDFLKGNLREDKAVNATSKILLETMIKDQSRKYSKEYIILRPTNIYGYFPNLFSSFQLIPSIIQKIKNNKKLDFINAKKHTRDFINSKDIGCAIEKIILKGLSNDCYTISSGENIELESLVLIIQNMLNKKNIYFNNIENDMNYFNIKYSNKKFSKKYNWRPKYLIKDGISSIFKNIII